MRQTSAIACCALLALAGCATGPSIAYRAPQVTINGGTVEAAKMTIVRNCVSGGGSIEQNTADQLVCSKPMDGSFGSMMYRALATPNYSTNPDGKVRYSFVQAGDQLYITADMYLEYQTAFGQVNRTPITNGNVAAQGQAMLDRIKSEIESGPVGLKSLEGTKVAPVTPCKACETIGNN